MPLSILQALSEEMESLQRRVEEVKEWCPEQSCCGGREATVTAVWRRVSRLLRCMQELTTRSKQRIAEWSEITNSVSKTTVKTSGMKNIYLKAVTGLTSVQ